MHFTGKGLKPIFKPKHLFINNKTSILFANQESIVKFTIAFNGVKSPPKACKPILRSTYKLESKANNKLLNQDLIQILRLLLVETSGLQAFPPGKLTNHTHSPQQRFTEKARFEIAFNNVKSEINPQSLWNNNQKVNISTAEVKQQTVSLQTLKPLHFVQNVIYKSLGRLAYPETVEANLFSIRTFNPNLTSLEFAKEKALSSKLSLISTKKGTSHRPEGKDKIQSQACLTYLNYYYFHKNTEVPTALTKNFKSRKQFDSGLTQSNQLGGEVRLDQNDSLQATLVNNKPTLEFQHWVVKPKNSGIALTQPSGFIQKRSFLSYWIIPFVGFYTFVVSFGTSSGGVSTSSQHSFPFGVADAKPGNILSSENKIIHSNHVSETQSESSTELPLEKIWFTSQTDIPYFGKQTHFQTALGEEENDVVAQHKTNSNNNIVTGLNSSYLVQKKLSLLFGSKANNTGAYEQVLLEKKNAKAAKSVTAEHLTSENFLRLQKELVQLTMDGLLNPLKVKSQPYLRDKSLSFGPTKPSYLEAKDNTVSNFPPCYAGTAFFQKYKMTKSCFGFLSTFPSGPYWNKLDQSTEYKLINQDVSNIFGFKESLKPLPCKYLYSLKTTFFKNSIPSSAAQQGAKSQRSREVLAKPSLLEFKKQQGQLTNSSFADSIEKTKTSFVSLLKGTTKLDLGKMSRDKQNVLKAGRSFVITSQTNSPWKEKWQPTLLTQIKQDQFILISSHVSKKVMGGLLTKLKASDTEMNLTPVTNSKKIINFLETLTTTYNWDLAKNIYNLNPKAQFVNPEIHLQNITLKQSFKNSIADSVKTSYIVNLLKSKTNGEASPQHSGFGVSSKVKSQRLSRAFKTKSDSIYCFLSLNNKTLNVKESSSYLGFASATGSKLATDVTVKNQLNDFTTLSACNIGTLHLGGTGVAAEANNTRQNNPNIIKLQTPILTASRFKKVTIGNSVPITTQPVITNYTMRNNLGLQARLQSGLQAFPAGKLANHPLVNTTPVNLTLTAKTPYYTSNCFNNYLSYIQYKLTNFISIKTTNSLSSALSFRGGAELNQNRFGDKHNLQSSILSAKAMFKNYLPTKNSFVSLKQKSQSKLTSSTFLKQNLETNSLLTSDLEKANICIKPLNLTKNLRIVLEHKKMFVRKSLLNRPANVSLTKNIPSGEGGKEFAFEKSRYSLFSKSTSLAQEPLLELNRPAEQGKVSKQSLETKAELQKKRKARKQRLESRRQKKRKRFYPRPTWLRLRLSKIGQVSNQKRVLLNQNCNNIQDFVFNLQKSKRLNSNLQNNTYNLALAKIRSREFKRYFAQRYLQLTTKPNTLPLIDLRSKDFSFFPFGAGRINFAPEGKQIPAAFRIQTNSHKENIFSNLLQNSKKLKTLTSTSTTSQNTKLPLGLGLAKERTDVAAFNRVKSLYLTNNIKINKNLYTEYLYNNKLFIGKKILVELKNTNGKNYVTFEAKSTNPPPNTNKTNNNSFRDFWIWLYDLTSTNNWNQKIALNNIIPNLPIPIQNVKLKPNTEFVGAFAQQEKAAQQKPTAAPLSQKLVLSLVEVNKDKNAGLKQSFKPNKEYWLGENTSFSLLNKTPKKSIQFRTNANFKSLNWALNKTNLWASNTQRINLWSTQKLRNQSKNNKTKYLEKQIQSTINSGFSSLYLKSFLTKNNNNFYKFKISKKLHNKEHKLAYLESSFYNAEQNTKGRDFKKGFKQPFITQRKPVNIVGLQPLVAKPTLNLAWWTGLDMSWLNLTNSIESFISPSNLGQDLNTISFNSPERSLASLDIEFLKQSLKSNFIPDNKNTLTELTFIFAMHFCALISLLSISQIRSFMKFHLILLHKLSNGYLQVIYKNFNLTTIKSPFNLFNGSIFKASFTSPYAVPRTGEGLQDPLVNAKDKAISDLLKKNHKLFKFGFAQQKRLLAPSLGGLLTPLKASGFNNNNLINSRFAAPQRESNLNSFGKAKTKDYTNTGLLSSAAPRAVRERKSFILKQSLTKADVLSLAKPTLLKAIYDFASGLKGKRAAREVILNYQMPYSAKESNIDKPIDSVYSSIKSLNPLIQTKPVILNSDQQLSNQTISNSTKPLTFIGASEGLLTPLNAIVNPAAQQRLFTKRNAFSKNLETFNMQTLPAQGNSFDIEKPKIELTSLRTFIKFFQQLLVFIKYKKAKKLAASKNLTTKAINVNSLSSQILLTEVTSETIQNIQKTTLNTSYKIVDTFEYFLRIIYSFFEKPAELTMDWIAYAFLVEWSSDFLTFTPEKGEKQIWLAFSKWARHTRISNTLTTKSILTATLNLTLGQFLYKRVLYFNDQLLEIINRPDTDLMNRQKKGTLFWDIWSDVLIKAADKYNINVPSLSNIKEEQNILIDKFLGDNLNTKRLPIIQNGESKLTPKALAFNNIKSSNTGLSKIAVQQTIYGLAKLKPQGLMGLNNSLGEFSGIQTRHTRVNLKDIDSISAYFALTNVPNNGIGIDFSSASNQKQKSLETPNSFANFELLKKSTQDINQFVTYQSKETDLFLDYHPPKSFAHISAIRYYTLVQQPLGTLVCQIYSGLLTKQIAKNVLVIGSTLSSNTNTALERTQKTLLIQALAGETEIKIITDNASRYAVVNRGFAVGIKLLKDVFEAITLNTPCLFLLEDIHLIGERRPLLISDTGADSGSGDELSKATENTFGAQRNGEAVHEKNQVLYQLNRHGITHYKKPFKGDFSLSIPTNHFAFDLFLKSRYTNYSATPTHPFAYSLGSLDTDKISAANNPGQNTQTAEFSLTNKLQKLTSKRSSSSSNFETTNTGQFLASSLQFGLNSLNKLLSPPSTSPFTVLLLKEQKKLKPKRIVKELPWVGLSSSEQQLGLAPAARVSYSVRAKIAALADLGFTNMSAKLDMITDLLVIIDSVRGNRGFVVFATTHLPHTLDPALRRPGRLDETISIPTLSNIWTRWEFTKGTQPIFTNVFALEKSYSSLKQGERNRTIIQSNNRFGLFSPSTARLQGKGVQQLFNNYIYSSQHLVKYYGSIEKFDFINLDFVSNNNNNVLSSIVNGYKQLAFNQSFKNQKADPLWDVNLNQQKGGLDILKSNTFRSGSNKITKQLYSNNGNISVNNVKSIYTAPNTKRIQQMGQIAYHQIGKKIITNKYSFNLSSLTSIYNNPTTYDSTLALTETSEYLQNQSQYSGLYSSPEFIKKTLICLLSGKLSEQFSVSNFALTLNPRTTLTTNGQTSNPFKAAQEHTSVLSFPSVGGRFPAGANLLAQNRKNFLCATLYGIDQTWRAATSLALSFVQKRYLYNKNLIIPKLMNFTNYTPLEEAPSPPTSNILIPAKRYENAKKALKENIEQKVTRSIQDKLEAHTKQSYIKSIYQKNKSLLSPDTNTQLNVTGLISLETSNNPLTQITSSYVVYENKIVKRHRNYLTNQWWNGQLTEHSSETLFLSDIDWRYTFIDNLNNPTLSQNQNLFFNKLRSSYSPQGSSTLGVETFNLVKNQTKEFIKAPIQSQDIVIDFPDADQSYNPKNRRWILTSGDWDSWFNFDKKLQTEIFQHLISECIVQSYVVFDKNRELLDYAAAKYMKKGLLKNQNLTVAFKKFT
jgi:hypothetical protein